MSVYPPIGEPANEQQLRLLISLYRQLALPYDPAELATLDKWQAAERITTLRGRPAATSDELNEGVDAVLQARAEAFGIAQREARAEADMQADLGPSHRGRGRTRR